MNDAAVDVKTILALPVQGEKCPDFDEDCQFTPEEAWHCWIGGWRFIEKTGLWVYTEQARGNCPLIHTTR